jgi:endo-1,4-beta-xylanase
LDDSPVANATVDFRQTRNRFLFGSNVGYLAARNEAGLERWDAIRRLSDELFNFVTLPFYWGQFEPEQGRPDTEFQLRNARDFVSRGYQIKGHPLCWHSVSARWLRPFPTPEVERLQTERVRREVRDFQGVIDMWDGVNEAVIMPDYDHDDNAITRWCREIGNVELIRKVFDAARETNPNAIILLNDFNMSPAYEELIGRVLDAGIAIDAIGLQSHMHQGYWGAEKAWTVCERFSRFGIPLHFTELTMVSGELMPKHIRDICDFRPPEWPTTPEGEARQAAEIEEFYSILYSHPAVEAITWWDIVDGQWLRSPAGMLRPDLSTKPSFETLRRLIKQEWTAPAQTLATDAEGRLRFAGSPGEYAVSANGRQARFAVAASGAFVADVRLATE